MPDVKISALPASTTPLAGTEVLPIVQSATTRQVSVANLTAGRAVNALSLTASSLTSGRVTYAGASGLLSDSAALTFDGTNLSVTSPSTATTFTLSDNGARLVVLKNSLGTGGPAEVGTTTNHDFYVRAGAGAAGLNSLYLQAGNVTGYSLSYAGLHAWFNGATQAMTLLTSGVLLVGKTASNLANAGVEIFGAGYGQFTANNDASLFANRLGSDGDTIKFYRATSVVGSISVTASLTSYNVTSDQSLKTNIVNAPVGNINSIKVRSFDWIVDGSHQEYGMVAQELIEVAPYAVNKPENPDEMMGVDYSKLVPMMIKEIQELKQRITALENK
jgi:hypothetical protein